MLNQDKVNEEEEHLRQLVGTLTDEERRVFYRTIQKKLRDPDTYASLNWFFITGIHHFYLGKWIQGLLDLALFIIGVLLILVGRWEIGIGIIVVVSIIEMWALFRAQIIVQDWNNKVYKKALKNFMGKHTQTAVSTE